MKKLVVYYSYSGNTKQVVYYSYSGNTKQVVYMIKEKRTLMF